MAAVVARKSYLGFEPPTQDRRLKPTVTFTTDGNGNANGIDCGTPGTGDVWLGTIVLSATPLTTPVPASAIWVIQVAGVFWGLFYGGGAGRFEAWDGENITITATGLTPLTQYTANLTGAVVPREAAAHGAPFPQAPGNQPGAPSFIAASFAGTANAGGSGQLAVPVPAGVTMGDLMVLAVYGNTAGGLIGGPAGWQTAFSPSGGTMALFWRIATASEPASYNVTGRAFFQLCGAMFLYSAAAMCAPVPSSTSGTPVAIASPLNRATVLEVALSWSSVGPGTVTTNNRHATVRLSANQGGCSVFALDFADATFNDQGNSDGITLTGGIVMVPALVF